MKAFMCHAGANAEFVIQVARFLKVSLEKVFYFEDPEQNRGNFLRVLKTELASLDVMVVFVGSDVTSWQRKEIETIEKRQDDIDVHIVFIGRTKDEGDKFLRDYAFLTPRLVRYAPTTDAKAATWVAQEILHQLQVPFRFEDGLPRNPHLFSYEKDIIDFFKRKARLGSQLFCDPEVGWTPSDRDATDETSYRAIVGRSTEPPVLETPEGQTDLDAERKWRAEARDKLLDGCPSVWPRIERWEEIIRDYKGKWPDISKWSDIPYKSGLKKVVFRRPHDEVMAAALSAYHSLGHSGSPCLDECMLRQGLCFPEAGPRKALYFPTRPNDNTLNVAVLVSGGIAPGINSVIDGIVQRHWLYARSLNQEIGLKVYGLQNGFRSLDEFATSYSFLVPDREEPLSEHVLVTADHANEGGSMLGTSRVDELLDPNKRMVELERIVSVLRGNNIDILYVIGGDGSMKAAHAVWSLARHRPGRPLSVVAVPKTMDNDILWVWQAFGFLSAVEKARETIEHLHTEVRSNPRLCVLQLFGSDSGFVVSHSVVASATGHCDVALIPEVPFSMTKLAKVLKEKMCRRKNRIPYGLVVMAETAIPTDASDYAAPKGERPKIDIDLSRDEQDAILVFQQARTEQKRMEGQTSDLLRTAGLKIVSRGLSRLLPAVPLDGASDPGFNPEWGKLRVLVSEPRHLLRSVSPSLLYS